MHVSLSVKFYLRDMVEMFQFDLQNLSITGGSFNKNTPTGWVTERAVLSGRNVSMDNLAWSVCRHFTSVFVGNVFDP